MHVWADGVFRDILDGVMGWRWYCAGNVDMIGRLELFPNSHLVFGTKCLCATLTVHLPN